MSRLPNVGEDLVFLGQTHRITDIQPYRHPDFPDQQWWIASDAYGWAMTLMEEPDLGHMVGTVYHRHAECDSGDLGA